ncbi:hypothetical protein DID75_00510 [Candidatus Marinamargulisbacteria bacterium SCGC AG-410-N11]|nr:hypothetical protein DID75_00510 [Candidatus Marinamargulisbacteria bacterium SCGC AG-410-N11]
MIRRVQPNINRPQRRRKQEENKEESKKEDKKPEPVIEENTDPNASIPFLDSQAKFDVTALNIDLEDHKKEDDSNIKQILDAIKYSEKTEIQIQFIEDLVDSFEKNNIKKKQQIISLLLSATKQVHPAELQSLLLKSFFIILKDLKNAPKLYHLPIDGICEVCKSIVIVNQVLINRSPAPEELPLFKTAVANSAKIINSIFKSTLLLKLPSHTLKLILQTLSSLSFILFKDVYVSFNKIIPIIADNKNLFTKSAIIKRELAVFKQTLRKNFINLNNIHSNNNYSSIYGTGWKKQNFEIFVTEFNGYLKRIPPLK